MGYVLQLPNLLLSLIDLRSSSIIAISDVSTYTTLPVAPNYNMQITPPGYPTLSVAFTPGQVNVYQCADLGLTCGDTDCTPLPDGIYAVVYTVRPAAGQTFTTTTINQKFIKIDHIKCKYQHAFLKIDLECVCHDRNWDTYMGELRMIKLFIDGSVAACNDSNYALSEQLYKRADTMLNGIGKKFKGFQWPKAPLGCNIC